MHRLIKEKLITYTAVQKTQRLILTSLLTSRITELIYTENNCNLGLK